MPKLVVPKAQLGCREMEPRQIRGVKFIMAMHDLVPTFKGKAVERQSTCGKKI